MQGQVYQLNIKPKVEGERGLPKIAIESAFLSFRGLEGDYNNYRTEKKSSTLERAVLILPLETIAKLKEEGWPIKPGHLGENITTSGIPYESLAITKKYSIGEAIVEISEVCKPCTVLSNLDYIGIIKIPLFIKTLIGRRGWYAKIIQEGLISKGDLINEVIT